MLKRVRLRSQVRLRCQVRCHAAPGNARTIFQADLPSIIMSIDEIKGLLDSTSKSSEKNRRDIFYSMGLDYDKVSSHIKF
jgi:hypothetical protein